MADERQLLELIANNREGVLAAVTRGGYPHLTNVWYTWDPEERIARVSTTAPRVKGRIVRHNPHAALYVPGPNFWSYTVAEADAETSEVASTAGDAATRELFQVHSAFDPGLKEDERFSQRMIEAERLVIRLRVTRVYGLAVDKSRGS